MFSSEAKRSARLSALFMLAACALISPAGTSAAEPPARGSLQAVVEVKAKVPAEARTATSLGTERAGSGVVIDDSGLVLTIGYLIMEAAEVEVGGAGDEALPANVVAYDYESGFGLLRTAGELGIKPLKLGDSDAMSKADPALVVSHVGELEAAGVFIVDRRDFAGYWEYLLEDAIFTAPPHREFGGAALLDREGRLVGIGSLIVGDAGIGDRPLPGNMFVPINALKPVLGDLLANGRRSDPPRPWLGVYLEEHRGRLFVTEVSSGGPAATAGIVPNDLILGVGGEPVRGLADFYRKLWRQGEAGVDVPLDVLHGRGISRVVVPSGDRYRWLRLNPTY